jgi:DNA-binding XRE family transcriptional regulator
MTAHSGSPFSATATPLVEKAPPAQDTPRAACNLRTGRQLRAARVLAGLTQKTLGAALGVDQRMVRFMERRHHTKPTRAKYHRRIEQVLLAHGVLLISDPAPGAMLAN